MCTSSAERGAGAQARIRADAATRTDVGFVDVAEGLDAAACGDFDVAQHAVGADADAFAEHDLALEHAIDIDGHVAPAREAAAHVDARRIRQRGARLHQACGRLPLENALELGQLRLAVDAQRFPGRAGLRRTDRHLVRHRGRDHVGEVILLLRVLVLQAGEPGFRRAVGNTMMPVLISRARARPRSRPFLRRCV